MNMCSYQVCFLYQQKQQQAAATNNNNNNPMKDACLKQSAAF